ncbi:hypothetical protein RIF29_19079 [Crotalaria pallida]|uniref:Uncharacterized protein n=1 Tax=Crotalaria pallida TaxID=3830 RepID=A0AAN9F158_CROPI
MGVDALRSTRFGAQGGGLDGCRYESYESLMDGDGVELVVDGMCIVDGDGGEDGIGIDSVMGIRSTYSNFRRAPEATFFRYPPTPLLG